MEKILYNGKFITLENDIMVSALLIRDDRIAALGTFEEMEQQAPPGTPHLDLQGHTVLPGIVDSHNHIIAAGVALGGVLLFGASTIDEACQRIRDKADSLPAGAWLQGAGWIESQFKENRPLSLAEMDAAAPRNPLILHRLFGGSLANSLALERAGISRGSGQPQRGEIVRDSSGNPTGYLKNGAQNLVSKVIPLTSAVGDPLQSDQEAIIRACTEYIKHGITTILEPGVSPRGMRAYQMTRQAGKLPLRVAMMPAWHGLYATMDDELDHLVPTLGVTEGFGDEWLRFAALKMAVDGGVGSKTAMMNEPWIDGSRTTIPLRLDLDKLESYFLEGDRAGWSIGIHCCGDLAQDIACRTFARVCETLGGKRRHHIIHGYFPTPEALDLMAKHDIGVSVQPGFIYVEGDIYEEHLSQEKVHTFKPLKTYLKHGIRVFANSDMTSAHYNPFLGIYSAVTRRTSQGLQLGESECVPVDTALQLFIKNGAWYCGLEDSVGSLKAGKQADLAVLDRDILSIPSEEIKNLKVIRTFVAGKEVYQAD
ncbi:MAG: amidohydrolase [Symbiobacteriaceae bacterium]|nr:amidohydrolase [Symbiobacteriaceae bacterium]